MPRDSPEKIAKQQRMVQTVKLIVAAVLLLLLAVALSYLCFVPHSLGKLDPAVAGRNLTDGPGYFAQLLDW